MATATAGLDLRELALAAYQERYDERRRDARDTLQRLRDDAEQALHGMIGREFEEPIRIESAEEGHPEWIVARVDFGDIHLEVWPLRPARSDRPEPHVRLRLPCPTCGELTTGPAVTSLADIGDVLIDPPEVKPCGGLEHEQEPR